MKYSKFIVALVIILNVIFTAAVLYVFYYTSVEPVALIAGWFAFTTGELWFLSGITKIRIKEGDDDE
jgi:hypothetical protein